MSRARTRTRTADAWSIAIALAMAVASVVPAFAADADPDRDKTVRQGRAMVVSGLVVQGVGLTMVAVGRTDFYLYSVGRPIVHGVSIPFAPITADGFRRLLSDGTPASDLRALSIGLFEGAAYSGLVALVDLVIQLAITSESSDPDDSYGMGPGPALAPLPWIMITAHAGGALGMLIPGIITAASSKQVPATATASVPVFVPWATSTEAGVAVVGRF